jgi:hypothetical protein
MPHKDREAYLAYFRNYRKTHPDKRYARDGKPQWRRPWFYVVGEHAESKDTEAASVEGARWKAPRFEVISNLSLSRRGKPRQSGAVARKAYYQKLKRQIFEAYGGARCACCGEVIASFLTLDHVNNDGYKDRHGGKRGIALYLWLKQNGFPSGFQVLCFNCNCGRSINGGICPHQVLKIVAV